MSLHHLGLRAQIVLSLAALLAVVFSFTGLALLWVLRVSLETQRRELVTATSTVVMEGLARRVVRTRSEVEVGSILEEALGTMGMNAVGIYDEEGRLVAGRATEGRGPMIGDVDPRRPRPFQTVQLAPDGRHQQLVVIQPLGPGRGSLVGVVPLGARNRDLERLARPVLVYLFASALLLLVFGYVALTNLIVRPLEALTRATAQVSQGRFDVTVPVKGGREIATAAKAFNAMTRQLREHRDQLEKRLQELQQTAEELRSTQRQLVRSARLASVGSLAAGIAHEVGNPVSAIMGLSEIMTEGGLPEEESIDYARRINREAERVHRIIRDLLQYARGTPEGQQGPASVAEAIETAVGLVAPQKSFRLVQVQTTIDEDLPLVAIGLDELTQVLLNLLMNAADALEGEGSVSIRARLEDEPPSGDPSPRRVVIEVSDNGPGVPDEQLERLFEPFFTTKEPGKGTGLGLAMCESIVVRAGGAVAVKNNPSGGLTVSLYLPAGS